ncbi:unnamed protein product, partial [Prorocentrum cordatum]
MPSPRPWALAGPRTRWTRPRWTGGLARTSAPWTASGCLALEKGRRSLRTGAAARERLRQRMQVQLDALGDNDAPFRDHGVKTMYTFCGGAGLLELHEYFGYKKDLYHEEHFFGRFKSTFAKLIGHRGYTIDSSEERADESGGSYWVVRVSV